jgi:hypothetical protein
VLFFPLVLAPALHGSWQTGLLTQGAVVVSYSLAMVPDALEGVRGDGPALIFFRLAVFVLVGVFALAAGNNTAVAGGEEAYTLDEDGSLLLERVANELETRRGVQVGVILVDPGRRVGDVDLLMERVRARIGEPILLGEGMVFGVVLSGADDHTIESAARRALARRSLGGGSPGRRGGSTGGGFRDRESQRHRPRRPERSRFLLQVQGCPLRRLRNPL